MSGGQGGCQHKGRYRGVVDALDSALEIKLYFQKVRWFSLSMVQMCN